MGDPRKIFISYSHRDAEACTKIDSLLEKQEGFSVWYDKGLIPGEVYRRKIAEVIRDSGYFIILLSNNSVNSDWVLDEVEYAKKLRKRILPIWIENVEIPDDLDMILQRYHSLFWHLRSSDIQFERSLLSMFDLESGAPQGQALVGFGNQFSEAVNKKMKDLLAKEKRLQFKECYSPENAVILGSAYLYGGPCAVNRQKARHYFRTAEYFSSRDGEFYLLQMELADQIKEAWDDPDEETCRPHIERITQLAEDGSVPAKLYMGNLYWYGRLGCPKDTQRSAALYEECAKAGNARAQYLMSSNYYHGDGVDRDYELAKMYANLALEQKHIYAWRRWGKFFRDGLAVPQDFKTAREFYENGAKMGDYNCFNKIGDMLYHGWGGPVDYAEAVRYFREGEKAPAFGQSYCLQRAKMALGRAYERGEGVERDLSAAAEKYLEGYYCGSLECRDAYLRCSQQLQPAT
ncbi:MAG: toll/interleukin-1 receptor domain-containing protein [Oscillospiraceae bacterium]|nr:toll/interleukin-1 receptor domain-containing protein [Oscillospiraceae bacterium]